MQAHAVEWALFLLQVWNGIVSITKKVYSTTYSLYTELVHTFGPKEYLFFQGCGAAYRVHGTSLYATGSARPQWLYIAKEKTFYEWCGYKSYHMATKSTPLPILSLELKEAGQQRPHYDLTDFLETVKVYRATNGQWSMPSLPQILGAWKLSSGIVVDTQRFHGKLLTDMADERYVDLKDHRPVDQLLALEDGEVEGTEQSVPATPSPSPAPAPAPSNEETWFKTVKQAILGNSLEKAD